MDGDTAKKRNIYWENESFPGKKLGKIREFIVLRTAAVNLQFE